MPTANERKALWFFAFVAMSGTAVRLWRVDATPASAADETALVRQIGRIDSARAVDRAPKRRSERSQTPKTVAPDPGSPIDLDRASAAEIETLPGIGPALADRIVANRDSLGGFGTIDALCDVRGVGPALAKRLRPLVTFTGPPRPLSGACGDGSKKAQKTRQTRPR